MPPAAPEDGAEGRYDARFRSRCRDGSATRRRIMPRRARGRAPSPGPSPRVSPGR